MILAVHEKSSKELENTTMLRQNSQTHQNVSLSEIRQRVLMSGTAANKTWMRSVVLISLFYRTLASISLNPITVDTNPSPVSCGYVSLGARTYSYSSVLNVTVYPDSANQYISVFDVAGNFLATSPTLSPSPQGLVLYGSGNMQSFGGSTTNGLTLQSTAASYALLLSMTQVLTVTGGYKVSELRSNTTLIYLGYVGGTKNISSYDYSTNSIVNNLTTTDFNSVLHVHIFNSSFLLVTSGGTTSGKYFLVDAIGMSILQTFMSSTGQTTPRDNVFNNLNYSQLIGTNTKLTAFPNKAYFSAYDLSNILTTTLALVAPTVLIPGTWVACGNNILNFGPYQYVGVLPAQYAPVVSLLVASKPYFDVINVIPLSITAANVSDSSLSTSIMLDDITSTLAFTMSVTSTYNVHMYNVTFDRCVYRDSAGVCHGCITGYVVLAPSASNQSNGICIVNATVPDGYGWLDSTYMILVPCAASNCALCSLISVCTICQAGYYANGGQCYLVGVSINPLTPLPLNVDLGFTMSFSLQGSPSNVSFPSGFYQGIASSLANSNQGSSISFVQSDTLTENKPQVQIQIVRITPTLIAFYVTLKTSLQSTGYQACYSNPNNTTFLVNGTNFTLPPFNSCIPYQNSEPVPSSALGTQATSQRILTASSLSPPNEAGTHLINLATSADPTGISTKLSQNLKIYIRMYFLNIKHGMLVDQLFEKGEASILMLKTSMTRDYMLASSLGYRGRVSKQVESLDFTDDVAFAIKVGVYLLFCVVKVVCGLLTRGRPQIGKGFLVFLFYLPKLHLVIFNSVFSDLLFYGTHSLMHCSSKWVQVFAGVALLALMTDTMDLMTLTYQDGSWMLFNSYNKKYSKEVLPQKEKGQVKSRIPLGPIDSKTSNPIDYNTSYRNIEKNMFSVTFIKGAFSSASKTIAPRITRIYFHLHLLRTVTYQVLFVVCQYVPALALSLFIVTEVSKCSIGLYCELKHRLFSSRIVGILECASSGVMAGVLIGFSLPALAKVPLSVNTQTACIICFLIVIFLEYGIMIGNIIYQVSLMISERKLKRADKYDKPLWFIQYGVKPQAQAPQFEEPLLLQNMRSIVSVHNHGKLSSQNPFKGLPAAQKVKKLSRKPLIAQSRSKVRISN